MSDAEQLNDDVDDEGSNFSNEEGDEERDDDLYRELAMHNPAHRNEATARPMVKRRPSLVRFVADDGTIPFHLACGHTHSLGLVKLLLAEWPESIGVKDQIGRLGLHHAVMGGADPITIRFLLERYPESIHAKDNKGRLALHYAVWRKVGIPILEFLVGRCPSSVRELDAKGDTILHMAILGFNIASYVEYLIRLWPEAVRIPNDDGQLPIHVAAEYDKDPAVLQLVIDQWPESIRERTNDGSLPIHFAASTWWSLRSLEFLLRMWPDSIRATNHDGDIPLHKAAANRGASEEQLNCLLGAWPLSTRVRNFRGMLPVHFAAGHLSPRQAWFVRAYPDSVRETDDEGRIPLHWTILGAGRAHPQRFYQWEAERVVDRARYLVELWPESTRCATTSGILTLHYAAGLDAPVSLARFFVEQWPESVRVASADQRVALHYAAAGAATQATVEFFSDQWPDALQLRSDPDGQLPLHLALQRTKPNPAVVRLLVERRPESVRVASADQRVALHHAAAGEADSELVEYVCDHWPDALQLRSHPDGQLPLHLAILRTQPNPDVVRVLVERRPESVGEFDSRGTHALHMAVSATDPSMEIAETLLEAFPESLQVADRRTGLYPALLAAANEAASIDLLYTLLVKWPEAVAGLDRRPPNKRRRV